MFQDLHLPKRLTRPVLSDKTQELQEKRDNQSAVNEALLFSQADRASQSVLYPDRVYTQDEKARYSKLIPQWDYGPSSSSTGNLHGLNVPHSNQTYESQMEMGKPVPGDALGYFNTDWRNSLYHLGGHTDGDIERNDQGGMNLFHTLEQDPKRRVYAGQFEKPSLLRPVTNIHWHAPAISGLSQAITTERLTTSRFAKQAWQTYDQKLAAISDLEIDLVRQKQSITGDSDQDNAQRVRLQTELDKMKLQRIQLMQGAAGAQGRINVPLGAALATGAPVADGLPPRDVPPLGSQVPTTQAPVEPSIVSNILSGLNNVASVFNLNNIANYLPAADPVVNQVNQVVRRPYDSIAESKALSDAAVAAELVAKAKAAVDKKEIDDARAVRIIRVVARSNDVEVQWDSTNECQSFSFTLNSSPTIPKLQRDYGTTTRGAVFSDLKPETEYTLVVIATYSDGVELSSTPYEFSTTSQKSTSLDPDDLKMPLISDVDVFNYQVLIKVEGAVGANQFIFTLNNKTVSPSATEAGRIFQFHPLSPNSHYSLVVTAYFSDKTMMSSNPFNFVTAAREKESKDLRSKADRDKSFGYSGTRVVPVTNPLTPVIHGVQLVNERKAEVTFDTKGGESWIFYLGGKIIVPELESTSSALLAGLRSDTEYSLVLKVYHPGLWVYPSYYPAFRAKWQKPHTESSAPYLFRTNSPVSRIVADPRSKPTIYLVTPSSDAVVISWSGGRAAESFSFTLDSINAIPYTFEESGPDRMTASFTLTDWWSSITGSSPDTTRTHSLVVIANYPGGISLRSKPGRFRMLKALPSTTVPSKPAPPYTTYTAAASNFFKPVVEVSKTVFEHAKENQIISKGLAASAPILGELAEGYFNIPFLQVGVQSGLEGVADVISKIGLGLKKRKSRTGASQTHGKPRKARKISGSRRGQR